VVSPSHDDPTNSRSSSTPRSAFASPPPPLEDEPQLDLGVQPPPPTAVDSRTALRPVNDDNETDDLWQSLAWKFTCHLFDVPMDWNKRRLSDNTGNDQTSTSTSILLLQDDYQLPLRPRSSPIPVPWAIPTTATLVPPSMSPAVRRPPTNNAALPRRVHSLPDQQDEEEWMPDIQGDDGHVWRARYAVLEEGFLYFYRHRTDAESPVAVAERMHTEPTTREVATVTVAATPQQPIVLSSSFHHAAILAQSPRVSRHTTHVWEKRVPVSVVGAVRSAEEVYGAHALELLPLQTGDYDNDDRLILRAQSATEMSDWLWYFHRSIEVLVKSMISTSVSTSAGELIPHHLIPAHLASPNRFRFEAPVLSHGHGRNSLHRRRFTGETSDDEKEEETTMPWMPTAPAGQNGQLDHYSRLVSPAAPMRPHTPPPIQQQLTTQAALFEIDDLSPELSAPVPPEFQRPVPPKKYVPPHLRPGNAKNKPAPTKYVPPHLRKQHGDSPASATTVAVSATGSVESSSSPGVSSTSDAMAAPRLSLTQRLSQEERYPQPHVPLQSPPSSESPYTAESATTSPPVAASAIKMGGCADPADVQGSVLDACYIPYKASKLLRQVARPYGQRALKWEVGAVSECGARRANEDSYLIVGDLLKAFDDNQGDLRRTTTRFDSFQQTPGLFCVFDGHCGDQAARFAVERLTHYLYEQAILEPLSSASPLTHVEDIMRRAILAIDADFCRLCTTDGRTWESGATALIAALVDDDLVIANLGDARGVHSRSVDDTSVRLWEGKGWTGLPVDEFSDQSKNRGVWKEVTSSHSPSRPDERRRIEQANGWITFEHEIPASQAHRLDLRDALARDILDRCFTGEEGSDRAAAPHRLIEISRVCGELAVSRAIGDRDFKAGFNPVSSTQADAAAVAGEVSWDGSHFFPYPEHHSHSFTGDLVSNESEVEAVRIGQEGVCDECLLLACDGLWDVMDTDDAVRVTRRLLFDEGWAPKQTAARLTELAKHLGSSDNITVLVICFSNRIR
jgi:serine/threonine protein phosphatase PrpC